MYESPSVAMGRAHMMESSEHERATCVERFGLLDAGSDELTEVARRASVAMGTPIAAVTVLVREHQHLIATNGIDAPVLERDSSFCTHVTASGSSLTVADATRHPDFAYNPNVGFDAHSVRAYSGVPITTADGTVVAVLCVVDPEPRTFSTAQLVELHRLGDVAAAILLPASVVPPARAFAAAHSQDDLSRWIAANVPHEHDLEDAMRHRMNERLSTRLNLVRRMHRARIVEV